MGSMQIGPLFVLKTEGQNLQKIIQKQLGEVRLEMALKNALFIHSLEYKSPITRTRVEQFQNSRKS